MAKTKLYHPILAGVFQEVDDSKVDAWVAQGWRNNAPPVTYRDHAPVQVVKTQGGYSLRATFDDGEGVAIDPVARATSAPRVAVGDPARYVLGKQIPTTWETPDGSGVIVHPSVRHFPEAWNGYHWWAAATPYTNTDNQVENPCVYVSKDGVNFTTPPGVTNPLYPPQTGGYNSDTHLVQGPDGRLYLFFRDFSTVPAGYGAEKFRLTVSSDGTTWSDPVIVMHHDNNVKRLMSPAVWWDSTADEWVMLAVNIVPAVNVVERWAAKDAFGPWTLQGTASISPAVPGAAGVWHLDAVAVGSQVVALFQDSANDSGSGNLYLATSTDAGRTFSRGGALTAGGNYRSCISPAINERGLTFDVWASLGGPSWGTRRGLARVPGVESWQETSLEIQAAATPAAPFTLGDTFNRADSTTGLGTATSGQAWTASSGVLGISGGYAVGTADSTNQRAYIEAGVANAEVKARVQSASGAQAYLITRFQDANNYLRVGYNGTTLVVDRVLSGTVTGYHNVSNRAVGWHAITISCSGPVVDVYEDGKFLTSVNITEFQSATKVGIQTNSTATRFDNLTVKAL